jgi:hypothetical protein
MSQPLNKDFVMSVQKYILTKESSNFTVLPNEVLQGLHNWEALGFWTYLSSLPHGWIFYKKQLQEHGKIGIHKLEKLLKILVQNNLVSVVQTRNAQGLFAHFSLNVLNGSNNRINDITKKFAPLGKNGSTDIRATDIRGYKYNKIQKKEKAKKKEKEKSICATESVARVDNSIFDKFWQEYPVKKNKARSHIIWARKQLDAHVDKIITDVVLRTISDPSWQDKQYIPHPSTYLQGERWEDEIIENKTKTKNPQTSYIPVNNQSNSHKIDNTPRKSLTEENKKHYAEIMRIAGVKSKIIQQLK